MTTESHKLDIEFYKELFNQFGDKYANRDGETHTKPDLFHMVRHHFIVDDGYIGFLNLNFIDRHVDIEEQVASYRVSSDAARFGVRVTNCEGEGTGQIVEAYWFYRSFKQYQYYHVSSKIKFHAIRNGDDFIFNNLTVLGYRQDKLPESMYYKYKQEDKYTSEIDPSHRDIREECKQYNKTILTVLSSCQSKYDKLDQIAEDESITIIRSRKFILSMFSHDMTPETKSTDKDKYANYSDDEIKAKFDKEYKQEFKQPFEKICEGLITIGKEIN